jgi:hypothetical protein
MPGGCGHDGATGELFVRGMGESAGGYDLSLIFEGHHDASGIQKMKFPIQQ